MNRDQILNGQYCTSSGKRGWTTEAEALKHLGIAKTYRADDPSRSRNPGRVEEDVYDCKVPGCGLYHMRSATRSRRSDFTKGNRR